LVRLGIVLMPEEDLEVVVANRPEADTEAHRRTLPRVLPRRVLALVTVCAEGMARRPNVAFRI